MNINKQELINKIHTIDGLSADEKSALVELLNTRKKYGLVWEDKPEIVEERLREELPVLTEVRERAIISDDPDAPNHILIEGDNLEALTALSYTHAGKIDVIYIDPPYNTGNKDFVYNDHYVDKEDSYRHSKWLSFMSRRLKIAKQLLSDKGVIFISIDDNEQAQLKLLCDEILGDENFIATLPRITKASGKTTDKIAQNHDYLMIYAKSESRCTIAGISHDDKGFKNIDEYYKQRGKYKLNQTLDYDSLSYSSSLDYPITINGETFYPGGNYAQYLERLKGKHKRADWAWRWSEDLFNFGYSNGFIVVKSGKNGKRIYTKTYQRVSIEKAGDNYVIIEKERVKPVQSIQLVNNVFSNDNAKKELGSIFEDIPFDYPKPTFIMRYMLQTTPNCKTILDFFAGSGTTLHATMQLNKDDGGHRKCILVTNNENHICENVTYERNKRVINGYTTPKGEEIQGLTSNTLRYYKTDFIGRDQTSRNMRQLVYAATDMLCIKEDIYREVKTFGSLKLKASVSRYFEENNRRMLVIYNELAVPAFAEEISKMDIDGKVLIYVFAPGNYAYDDEFVGILDKVDLCALPAAIYNAYQKVLPKRRTKFLDGTASDGVSPELGEDESGELNLIFREE